MWGRDPAAPSPPGLWLPGLTWDDSHGRQRLPGAGTPAGPDRCVEPQSTGDIDVAAQHGGKCGVLGLQFAPG